MAASLMTRPGFLTVHPLADTIDRLFQPMLREGSIWGLSNMAPLDIRQTPSSYELEVSVPGYSENELDITLDRQLLTIRGRHEKDQETGEGEYVRRERMSRSIFRQVNFPEGVDEKGIRATLKNGVLQVTVPRLQDAEPHRIHIEAASEGSGQTLTGEAVEAPKEDSRLEA